MKRDRPTPESLAPIEADPILESHFMDDYTDGRDQGMDDDSALAYALSSTLAWNRNGRPS